MSVPRACLLIEAAPLQWFCCVAIAEDDYDFETVLTFGPRPTEDSAWASMTQRCPNPGGYDVIERAEVTDYHRALIARGKKASF